jgi:hypothetical protein
MELYQACDTQGKVLLPTFRAPLNKFFELGG